MANVDKGINAVIDILKEEHGYYKDLVELSKSKKNIIIEGKVAELDKMVKLEQNMIFNIGQLEKKREEEVARICAALDIESAQVTISDLAKMLEPQLKEALENIENKLREVFSELKAANDINGQLLEQSLEYIDYSINLFAGSGMETGSLYEDIGKKGKGQSKKNIFDTKV